MFLDRLRERGTPELRQEKWDDSKNNNINKGMTWQAERSPNLLESDYDKNLTKVEFSKKVERVPQEDIMYDFKFEAPTFGGAIEKREENRSKGIMLELTTQQIANSPKNQTSKATVPVSCPIFKQLRRNLTKKRNCH